MKKKEATKVSTNKNGRRESARKLYVEDERRPSMTSVANELKILPQTVRVWAIAGDDDPADLGRTWRKQRDDFWTSIGTALQDDRKARYVTAQGDLDDGTLADIRIMLGSLRGLIQRLAIKDYHTSVDDVQHAAAIEKASAAVLNLTKALETIRTPGMSPADMIRVMAGGDNQKEKE